MDELGDNDSESLADRAEAYRLQGDYERAIAAASEAIQLDPYNGRAHMTRADAYRMQGKYRRAIADATEAIRLDPGNLVKRQQE